MTNVPTSDASNATVDTASTSAGALFSTSDTGLGSDSAAVFVPSASGNTATTVAFGGGIPFGIPWSYTLTGLSYGNHAGQTFFLENAGMPTTLPFAFNYYFGTTDPRSPDYVEGVGWEAKVFSGNGYYFMAVIPRYTSLSFNMAVSNEGSGEVVIDRSDNVFQETLGTGGPGTDLIDYENVWQCLYNGEAVFEFLGTTTAEVFVSAASEAMPVTISGAGTGRCLQWAEAQPPGFPNVVYKLAALTDAFQVADVNLSIWNTTPLADITSGEVYIDTTTSSAAVAGTNGTASSAPYLGGDVYDASASAISADITPLAMPSQATNFIVNGSFVGGLDYWTTIVSAPIQEGGGSAISYTMDSYDGDGFCAQVTTTAATQGLAQVLYSILPNTYYQVTAFVKQQSSGPMSPVISLYDFTNSVLGFPSTTAGTVGEWAIITGSILTGTDNDAGAGIQLNVSINCGTATNCQFLVDTVNCFQYYPNTFSSMSLLESTDNTNSVLMEMDSTVTGCLLRARVFNEGVETDLYLGASYDPVQMLYWRIREYAGAFYFDTAPDGATWTNQGSLPYAWSPKSVELRFSSWWYLGPGQYTPMLINNINSSGVQETNAFGQIVYSADEGTTSSGGYNLNSANSVGLNNAYIQIPNVALWLDLLSQAQRRDTISFINPTFTALEDSTGQPWEDLASLIVSCGTDLETQLEASVAAINGDWIMYPGFQLFVGSDGALGTDLSSTVVFYASGHIIEHDRTRVRDQIANYIVASDGSGNLTFQTSPSSIAQWNQREQFIQSSLATDIPTLSQMANAALKEFQSEVSQRTLTVPPALPGRQVFVDYQLGDWIGVQNSNLTTNDKVRVVGISLAIDGTSDTTTIELTLETRIQLLIERMNVLLQKIAANADAQVIAAPGASSQNIIQTLNQNTSPSNYVAVVGDGSTLTYSIAHALGTKNVQVAVRQNGTPYTAYQVVGPGTALSAAGQVLITYTSLNTIQVQFYTAPGLTSQAAIIVQS